eukprot:100475_1
MFQQIFALIIISISFTLSQTTHTASLPTGYEYGKYDQLCLHPPSTAACSDTFDVANDFKTPGFTNCDIASSCCLCSSITCGTDIIPCKIFSVGPHSAYGVQWIDIIGNKNNNNNMQTLIDCKGENACANTLIKAKYITKVQCNGLYSCSNAMIIIDEPNTGFQLTCSSMGACESLQIGLNIGQDVSICDKDIILNSIECIGIESCLDLLFVVNNRGCNKLLIDSIECRDNACENAQFKFDGDITISNCDLTNNELDKTIGLKQNCLNLNLNTLICSGHKSCYKQVHNVIDVKNGFEVLCQGEYSCSEMILYIRMNNNNLYIHDNVIVININCVTENACTNAHIIIQNQISTKNIIVNYKCMAMNSCNNAVFITGGVPVAKYITCSNILFCTGCKYNGASCNHNDVILIQN